MTIIEKVDKVSFSKCFLKIQGANSSNIKKITEMLEQYFLLTERSQVQYTYLEVPFAINPVGLPIFYCLISH